MNKKLKNKKGITLIALVITIIVLLILAGISIASLTESGMFSQTKNAKIKTEIAREKEQIKIAVMTALTKDVSGGSDQITYASLEEALKKYEDIQTVEKAETVPDGATIVSKEKKKVDWRNLFFPTSIAAEEVVECNYAKITYNSGRIYYVGIKENTGKIYEVPDSVLPEEDDEEDEEKEPEPELFSYESITWGNNTSDAGEYLYNNGYTEGWVVTGLSSYGQQLQEQGTLPNVLTIPEKYNDEPVIMIKNLNITQQIEKIILPTSIKGINSWALQMVSSYGIQVELNEGLEYIGTKAFGGFSGWIGEEQVKLYIRIPDSVKVLGRMNDYQYVYNVYSYGQNLEEIEFGSVVSYSDFGPEIMYFRGTIEDLNNMNIMTSQPFYSTYDYCYGLHVYCLEDGKSCYQVETATEGEDGTIYTYEWKEITDMEQFITEQRANSDYTDSSFSVSVEDSISAINTAKTEALNYFQE